MTKIFLDTSFFKAIADTRDDFHNQSKIVYKKIEENDWSMITTNYIIDETMTLVRKRCGLEDALDLRDTFFKLQGLSFVRVNSLDEKEAWRWFENDWNKLSFTDCTSFAVMKRLELTKVATFDEHFKKAGFDVLV